MFSGTEEEVQLMYPCTHPRGLKINKVCDVTRVTLPKDYYIMARTAFATLICVPINNQEFISRIGGEIIGVQLTTKLSTLKCSFSEDLLEWLMMYDSLCPIHPKHYLI